MININFIAFKIFLIISQYAGLLESARILTVLGIPNPAENIFGTSLINALHDRGHDMTVIIRFSHDMELHKNVKKIIINDCDKIFREFFSVSAEDFDKTLFSNVQKFYGKSALLTSDMISNPLVKEIFNHKFDLIMIDTLMSEAFYGLGEYFNAPMIGVSSYMTTETLDLLVGNVSPVSIVPSVYIQHSFESEFLQRCLNVALSLFERLADNYVNLPYQRQLYKEIFPNATLSFDQANRNFALVLLNQHFSLSFPRPYVPNMIEVAGLHIEDKPEMLPLNLQTILNDTTQGVIYVCLDLDEKTLRMQPNNYTLIGLLRALQTLNYKILWHMDYLPPEGQQLSNILQISNVSRYALLAHPHVKLLITNGEIHDIIDAIHFAKPILGLPLFAHQHLNLNIATTMGYGLGIKFRKVTKAKLQNAVVELLHNPCYYENVKQLSIVFRDQPIKPRDKAIYWIEYVLRHKGAMHMRSKGRFLNIWQFHNIDVFAAYLASFCLFVFLIRVLIKYLCLFFDKSKHILPIKIKNN